MSLLGIDVGTTGCKAAIFSTEGSMIASAYEEYDVCRPRPGWAELDTAAVWEKVRRTIRAVVSRSAADPVTSLAVSSLGEAVVPVSADRRILGPSILNFDGRGEEYLHYLRATLDNEALYRVNGNTLGNQYSLTKLKWIKDHEPELYRRTHKFLHWSGFAAFMLGADPFLDYSLANRTLLFDVDRADWSEELLSRSGLDREKLPDLAPSGVAVGSLSRHAAADLGLPPAVSIVTGAHDQCANAVGCGVISEGRAVYGMGTYICITPVFSRRLQPAMMIERGLNTEHHAVPGRYVCFIYNPGGALLKWFRDTFAAEEHRRAREAGADSYALLTSEMPSEPSSVTVLPHFAPTGPPGFITESCGVMAGLHLDTSRGDLLKGILEGVTYYLKECVDSLPPTGIEISDYRAAGGGSKSDAWVQICADILGRPFVRPAVTEAGALGAAIMAGVGSGLFPDYETGVQTMVKLDRSFDPDLKRQERYRERFETYRGLYPITERYLRDLHRSVHAVNRTDE
jgi:xylulokinase